MNNDLAGRIIDGAHAGSLVLTPAEHKLVREHVKPNTTVYVDGHPVLVLALPMHILAPLQLTGEEL